MQRSTSSLLALLAVGCSTAVRTRPQLDHEAPVEPASPPPSIVTAPPVDDGPAILPSATRDRDGRLVLPGGPLDTARRVCDAEHDHCLRAGAWFVVEPFQVGQLRKATPVFEIDEYWYGWNAVRADGALYRTRVATPATLFPGRPVIVLVPDGTSDAWPDSEAAALLTKRWRITVVDSVDRQAGTFRIADRGDAFPIATARITVESR